MSKVAWGVMKTSSFGAIRTTSPYFFRTSSIAHGYRPESLVLWSIDQVGKKDSREVIGRVR